MQFPVTMKTIVIGHILMHIIRISRVMYEIVVDGVVVDTVRGYAAAKARANACFDEQAAKVRHVPAPGRISELTAKLIGASIQQQLSTWDQLDPAAREVLIEEHADEIVRNAALVGTQHELYAMHKGTQAPGVFLERAIPQQAYLPAAWSSYASRAKRYARTTFENRAKGINRAWSS